MNKCSQQEHHHSLSQSQTGAQPSARPERKVLETIAVVIEVFILVLKEPVGKKLRGVLPQLWIHVDRPHVEEDSGAFGDCVALEIGAR